MQKLILYFDWSQYAPFRLQTIANNAERFAKANICLAPSMHISGITAKSHNNLFTKLGRTHSFAPWESILQAHRAETTDLLFTLHGIMSNIHMELAQALSTSEAAKHFDIQVVFVVGCPVYGLERLFRILITLKDNCPQSRFQEITTNFLNLAQTIAYYKTTFGEQHVTTLLDTASTPCIPWETDFTSDVFAMLGYTGSVEVAYPPAFFCLQSFEARQLFKEREVRFNAYPSLDDAELLRALATIESKCGWNTSPVSPLHMRQQFLENDSAAIRNLENVAGFAPFSLSPLPCWLEEPAMEYSEQLDEKKVYKDFTYNLPEALATPLMQRYVTDKAILSPIQQQLFTHLQAKYAHIEVGEPAPEAVMTVLTMAYQHEKYIAECIESVLAQQTSFPVQHLIVDHCSSDNTPHIMADYAARHPSVRPVLLSSRVADENIYGLFSRAKTPYVALCDGDDYFLSPHKLQKQYDFLESNPQCALCSHPVKVAHEDAPEKDFVYPPANMLPRGVKKEYYLADLVAWNFIQTNSVVYRWRFRDGLPDWFRADLCPSDWYWHLLHAEQGKIGFIPEILSVYRRHSQALYSQAMCGKDVEHRKSFGMLELKTYRAVNEHFKGRYARVLEKLANHVFSNFLSVYLEENDSSLFDEACEQYSEFSVPFLKNIKISSMSKNKKPDPS